MTTGWTSDRNRKHQILNRCERLSWGDSPGQCWLIWVYTEAWRFWNKNLNQKPLALCISISSFSISQLMTSLLISRKDSLMNNWGGGMEEEEAVSDFTDAINVSSTGIQMLQLLFWGHTHQCMFAHSRRTKKHNLGNWATWGTCQRSWSLGGCWFYCSNCRW